MRQIALPLREPMPAYWSSYRLTQNMEAVSAIDLGVVSSPDWTRLQVSTPRYTPLDLTPLDL